MVLQSHLVSRLLHKLQGKICANFFQREVVPLCEVANIIVVDSLSVATEKNRRERIASREVSFCDLPSIPRNLQNDIIPPQSFIVFK